MNKIKLSILSLGLSLFIMSCGETNTESSSDDSHGEASVEMVKEEVAAIKTIAKDVDADEFKSLFESGDGILVDVRTAGEVAQGAIEGSINVDFNSGNFNTEIAKLDKEVPVYVYCAAGGRSGSAMKEMEEIGFVEVYNLVGGYGKWPFK